MGIALTFDDGPDPVWTDKLLDALADAGVPATFFVCAPAARSAPEVVSRIAHDGHDVAYHCNEHVRHSDWTAERGRADLETGLEALAALGVDPVRWRTPWGVVESWTEDLAAAHGLELCGWTDDTHDWRGDSAADMLRGLEETMQDGSVVLMHDGIGPGARRPDCRETIALLAPLAEAVTARGLEVRRLGAA